MPTDPSYDSYLKTLQDAVGAVKERIQDVLKAMAVDTKDIKVRAVGDLHTAACHLSGVLHRDYHPQWLMQLRDTANAYVANTGDGPHGQNLLNRIIKSHRDISSWTPQSAEAILDFDAVYRECYDKSMIPELFDRLVELMQKIINSGQIDSIKIRETLEGFIALLKKNRNGSYFSTLSTYQVVAAGMRNTMFHVVTSVPVLGPLVEGINDTMKEVDLQWGQIGAEMKEKCQSFFPFNLPGIGYSPTPRIEGPEEPGDDAKGNTVPAIAVTERK